MTQGAVGSNSAPNTVRVDLRERVFTCQTGN